MLVSFPPALLAIDQHLLVIHELNAKVFEGLQRNAIKKKEKLIIKAKLIIR